MNNPHTGMRAKEVACSRAAAVRGARRQARARNDGQGLSSATPRSSAKACSFFGIAHIRIQPYTRKTTGKGECFIRIKFRDWGLRHPFLSHQTPAVDLDRWISWHESIRGEELW